MGNTGRPSAGCYLCRARRVRCDGVKPHCMRCQRIGQTCPGYRDPRFPNFRHETVSTIKKAIKKTAANQERASKNRAGESGAFPDLWGTTAPIEPRPVRPEPYQEELLLQAAGLATLASHAGPQPALATPIEQQAACCFMANHVLVPAKPGGRGEYAFVYHTMKAGAAEPWFVASFRAVSLAALACRPQHRQLMSLAHTNYTKAIGAVNMAVQNPAAAMSDQTLGAVLLLALYETLACPSKKLAAFEAHIRGAIELVKMRGPRQIEDPIGQEMFTLARTRMLMIQSTFQGRDASPETSGWSLNCEVVNQASIADTLGQLGTWLIRKREHDFQVDHWLGRQSQSANPAQVRTKVTELLAEAETTARTMCALTTERCPAHLRPVVVWSRENIDPVLLAGMERAAAQPSLADTDFPADLAYSFHDHWMASFHMTCYGVILHFAHNIVRCVTHLAAPGDPRDWDKYEQARTLAERAIVDLIACVHYFTGPGAGEARLGDGTGGPMAQQQDSSQTGALAGMRAVYVVTIPVITTLYVAMTSEFATAAQKNYLRGRLRFIAEEGGLGQAEALLRMSS